MFQVQRPNDNNLACQLFRDNDNGNEENNSDGDNADDQEEDDDMELPYGNRSLAWTRRYRKLIPYPEARKLAMALGCRNKDDWDDPANKRGKYLISRPDEMYRNHGWEGWDEFLGIMRSYDDCKQIVQNLLKLRDLDEYRNFVQADTKRAAGLRIPARPDIVYRNRGTWISEDDFFGEFLDDE